MCYPMWRFNTAAMAAINTNSFNTYNLDMNLMSESFRTNSIMCMMPNPLYGSGYQIMQNYSLNYGDFKNWIAQSWADRGPNLTYNYNYIPAGGTGSNVVTNPSDPKEKEYQDIKGVLQKILNEKIFASNSDEIYTALTKTGTIDERLQAVKDALTKLGANENSKKAIARIALSDNDIKVALYDTGYNFATGSYGVQNDFADRTKYKSNDDLIGAANNAIDDLKIWHKDSGLAKLTPLIGSGKTTNAEIISNLSYLNRAAGTDGGFIKLLAYKWKEDVEEHEWTNEEKGTWKDAMQGAYSSLRTMALSINKDTLGDSLKSDYNTALDNFQTAFDAVKNGTTDTAKLNTYVNAFNKVYKMVRMIQAKKIDNDITSKYGYLNNTVSGIVPENIVVEETKKMLGAEKVGDASDINVSDINVTSNGSSRNTTPPPTDNTVEGKVQRLSSGFLKAVSGTDPKVYESSNDFSTSTPKTYYVVQDDKLIELKDAIRYMNGEFTMKDNTKKSLTDLIEANKNNADVDEQSIKDSVNFKKKLYTYIDNEKLAEEDPKGSNGEAILSADGGTITFVILGNEVFQIDKCDIDDLESATSIVFDSGKAKVGSTEYTLKKVADTGSWSKLDDILNA